MADGVEKRWELPEARGVDDPDEETVVFLEDSPWVLIF